MTKPKRRPFPTAEQTRAFLTVAQEGSWIAAGGKLRLSRSSVQQQAKRFEANLGLGDLFVPGAAGPVLTVVGELVVPRAEWMLDAVGHLRTPPTGRHVLHVSGYPVHIRKIAEVLTTRVSSPTQVRLVEVSDRSRSRTGELFQMLRQGRADVVVAPDGVAPSAPLRRLPGYRWYLRVGLPPGHALAGRDRMTIDDLEGLRVTVAPTGHRSRELFDGLNAAAARPVAIAVESSDQGVLLDMARHNSSYATVMPDDALGLFAPGSRPLLVTTDGCPVGGGYSVWCREVPDAPEPDQDGEVHLDVRAFELARLLSETLCTKPAPRRRRAA